MNNKVIFGSHKGFFIHLDLGFSRFFPMISTTPTSIGISVHTSLMIMDNLIICLKVPTTLAIVCI